MPWYRLSTDVLPLLITVSPLVGMVTTIVAARWNRALVRPLAVSNATFTLILIAVAICLRPAAESDGLREASKSPPGIEWLASTTVTERGPAFSGIRVRMGWWLNGISIWSAGLVALVVWAVFCRPEGIAGGSSVSNFARLLTCQGLLSASTFSSDGIASIVFLEMAAIPIYLIIGQSGDGNRRQVAGSWWTWQLIGGTCSLVGVTLLAVSQPWMQAEFVPNRLNMSFDSQFLTQGIQQLLHRSETALHIWSTVGPWSSAMLLLALLIRLPTFPFQGWYQATLMSAPTAASAIIAVAFPLAAFGNWLRWGMPLFGFHSGLLTAMLAVAALAGLLYAGIAAQSQSDLKRLLVLMSLAMLCVTSISLSFRNVDGVRAAWMMMLSHALSIPCGMLLVQMIEARAGTRDLAQLGACVSAEPRLAVLLNLLLLGWTGVPFLAGFSSLYQQLAGATSVGMWLILGEAIGLVALAAAGLRAIALIKNEESVPGRERSKWPAQNSCDTGNNREIFALAPFIILLVAVNVVPAYFVPAADATVPSRYRNTNQP